MLHEIEKFHFKDEVIPSEIADSAEKLFESYRESMVSAAISANERAVHWDDANRKPKMHVGCSFLSLGKNFDLAHPAITTGANSKPVKGEMLDYPNRKCAEMNALENIMGVDYPDKIKASPYEEVEQEDLGFIAAIVTVSEPMNTGEVDTFSHDVVYPCKQCMTNYQYLMEKNVISPKTIIYNARIKEGEVVAGEAIPLGALLEKLKDGTEERYQNTIKELLTVKNQAFANYREELKNIKKQFGSFKENEVPPILPDEPYKAQRGFQRERVEDIWKALAYALDIIIKAVKSAAEEGVPKQRIVDSLGLEEISLVMKMFGFNKGELEQISKKYEDFLLNISKEE